MAQTKYLDYAGLELLVSEIKAGDAAALKAAKDFVGAIPADATQSTVIAYLEQKIADAKAEATFDGKASSVTVEDANDKFTATTVEGALAEVKTIADANATAVSTLTGSGAGSVSKALQDAKDYADDLDSAMKTYVDSRDAAVMAIISNEQGTLTDLKTDAKSTIVAAINEVEAKANVALGNANNAQSDVDDLAELVGEIPATATAKTVVAYAKEVADAAAGDASQVASDLADEIERATQAESDLQDAIDAHKEAIDAKVETLVGEDTGKSVRTIASEETAKIVNKAPEAFDTLKEIADWIGTGDVEKTTAAEILTRVKANEVAISDEEKRAKGVEEGLQGAIDAINNAETGILKQAKEYANGLDSAMDTRVDALEAAIGENGSVATQIANAIDGLDSDKSQTAGADGLALSIKLENGKVTELTGSIAANTYDAHGAAADVQGATTKTVKDLEDALADIVAIPTADITKLFHPTEE